MASAEAISPAAALPEWLFNTLFSTNRWLHLVASTLLVGGVLFFVFVVPIATSDLKVEHQVAIFGKARWMFRKIVGWSILLLMITGALSLWRMWAIYHLNQSSVHNPWAGSTPWALAHVVFAVLGAAILIRVTATRKILDHPVPWMWIVLALLLVGMLLASITRQVRLNMDDRLSPENVRVSIR